MQGLASDQALSEIHFQAILLYDPHIDPPPIIGDGGIFKEPPGRRAFDINLEIGGKLPKAPDHLPGTNRVAKPMTADVIKNGGQDGTSIAR